MQQCGTVLTRGGLVGEVEGAHERLGGSRSPAAYNVPQQHQEALTIVKQLRATLKEGAYEVVALRGKARKRTELHKAAHMHRAFITRRTAKGRQRCERVDAHEYNRGTDTSARTKQHAQVPAGAPCVCTVSCSARQH